MSPKTRPSKSRAAVAPRANPRPSLTPPPRLMTEEDEKAIQTLAAMASVPGAEKMSAAFLKDYGVKTRPANEEEGEARVALFKTLVKAKNVEWSATTLVNAGLAFPQPRKVKSKGRKEPAAHPCSHCLSQVPPLACIMTVVDDGMSLKNYCDACSQSKSKCSIGPARDREAIALATAVGAGLRGLGTQLRTEGFQQGQGPLATTETLMEDLLNLLQVTAPLASATVRKALAGADTDTQKLSESIVNPLSAAGPSQVRGHSRRPYSRAPTVKSEYRGRDSVSPYKGNRSPWKGKAKMVSDVEEGSDGGGDSESDDGDSEDRGSSPLPPRDLKRARR